MNSISYIVLLLSIHMVALSACGDKQDSAQQDIHSLQPMIVSEPVEGDADDPAIWLDRENPAQSLILGTDKAGILFAFDLSGKIQKQAAGPDMKRLNNVDIEYDVAFGDTLTDIAVASDRDGNRLYVFAVPSLRRLGSIGAFAGETLQRPMGVALYRRPGDGVVFAIVSRKEGPTGAYLWQYRLEEIDGGIGFTKVRAFGEWGGKDADGDGEIEAVAVDDELGYVYYSDEIFGIRKYHADPDAENAGQQLAIFGTDGFARDREGIAIYCKEDGKGFLLVSDQQANKIRVFPREGAPDDPHRHELLQVISLSARETDGCDATSAALNSMFPNGLFVAMSDDRTFHFYDWRAMSVDNPQALP